MHIISHKAAKLGCEIHLYHSKDFIAKKCVGSHLKEVLWRASSSAVDDSLRCIPLFKGMKVMITDNIAFSHRVVNGAQEIVDSIKYEVDEHNHQYPIIVYMHIPNVGTVSPDLGEDIILVFPENSKFALRISGEAKQRQVIHWQVPIVPGYAYTDYKSQGCSLDHAIVDIQSAGSLQGIYVMLSHVCNLNGLAILHPFNVRKLKKHLSQELQEELARIDILDIETKTVYETMKMQFSAKRHLTGQTG